MLFVQPFVHSLYTIPLIHSFPVRQDSQRSLMIFTCSSSTSLGIVHWNLSLFPSWQTNLRPCVSHMLRNRNICIQGLFVFDNSCCRLRRRCLQSSASTETSDVSHSTHNIYVIRTVWTKTWLRVYINPSEPTWLISLFCMVIHLKWKGLYSYTIIYTGLKKLNEIEIEWNWMKLNEIAHCQFLNVKFRGCHGAQWKF